MNIASICTMLQDAGNVEESAAKFESISMETLKTMAENDEYAGVVKKALEVNSDSDIALYLHQFKALLAIAQGKDVLLTSPCGSGKTRVLENAPMVA